MPDGLPSPETCCVSRAQTLLRSADMHSHMYPSSACRRCACLCACVVVCHVGPTETEILRVYISVTPYGTKKGSKLRPPLSVMMR